jgi:hypothetical protein
MAYSYVSNPQINADNDHPQNQTDPKRNAFLKGMIYGSFFGGL